MTASLIIGIATLIFSVITIYLCVHHIHGWAATVALITSALSIGQVLAYIPTPHSTMLTLVSMFATFFTFQFIIELRFYRKEHPKSYDNWRIIPVGVSYVQNLDGTYRIVSDDEAQNMIADNINVHTNTIFKQTTRRFASETDKQKYLEQHNMNKYPRLNETTVNAICNMFRSSSHTIGYDPQTPLGRIARVAYTNWHCRGQTYPEWHMAEYEQPTEKDLTEHNEILVLATDGTYHICDPTNTVTRDDESVEWFNGDVFIKPYLWMVIPIAIKKWNITTFPNIPLDPETKDRKF